MYGKYNSWPDCIGLFVHFNKFFIGFSSFISVSQKKKPPKKPNKQTKLLLLLLLLLVL